MKKVTFNSEQELVNTFLSVYKKFFNNFFKKTVVRQFAIEEFDSKFGIADIVIGSYIPYLSSQKLRKGIDPNWLTPLVHLDLNTTIDIDQFMSTFDVSKSTARQKLKEYSEANFLKPIGKNKYKIVKNYELIIDTVISFEAKLRNWKKALTQAYRYKRFSNYSFVLLDEKYVNPAIKNISLFKKYNIGLITMKKNTFITYYIPQKMEQKNSYQYLRINEVAYSAFKENFVISSKLDSKQQGALLCS